MSFKTRFGSFPIIETDRLRLREIDPERDAGPRHAIWSDEQSMAFIPDPLSPSVEDCQKVCQWLHDRFYDNGYILAWAITLRGSDEFIGGIRYINWYGHEGRIGEVGFELAPERRKQGLMTEALLAVCQFGFDRLGLERVQLTCHVDNVASACAAEKAKFKHEGTLRHWGYNNRTGRWYDEALYARLREQSGA